MNFSDYTARATAIVEAHTHGRGHTCKRWHVKTPADGPRGLLLDYVARTANTMAAHAAVIAAFKGDSSPESCQVRDFADLDLMEARDAFNKARADVGQRLGVDPLTLLVCDEAAEPAQARTAALDRPGGHLVNYRG